LNFSTKEVFANAAKDKSKAKLFTWLIFILLHSVVIYVSQVQRFLVGLEPSVCCEMALGAIALTDVSCRPAK